MRPSHIQAQHVVEHQRCHVLSCLAAAVAASRSCTLPSASRIGKNLLLQASEWPAFLTTVAITCNSTRPPLRIARAASGVPSSPRADLTSIATRRLARQYGAGHLAAATSCLKLRDIL
ncbi:hypothetical protein C8R43DRAFT_1119790 [Mycena crocata]|nr:hypothetical protein C8R43DRAFT_1119790 [Mycena crocata]